MVPFPHASAPSSAPPEALSPAATHSLPPARRPLHRQQRIRPWGGGGGGAPLPSPTVWRALGLVDPNSSLMATGPLPLTDPASNGGGGPALSRPGVALLPITSSSTTVPALHRRRPHHQRRHSLSSPPTAASTALTCIICCCPHDPTFSPTVSYGGCSASSGR